jgi:hypothetical protein
VLQHATLLNQCLQSESTSAALIREFGSNRAVGSSRDERLSWVEICRSRPAPMPPMRHELPSTGVPSYLAPKGCSSTAIEGGHYRMKSHWPASRIWPPAGDPTTTLR